MNILYTIPTCGICQVIKNKLIEKNIPFEEANGEIAVEKFNVNKVPILETEEKVFFSPKEISNWIKER